MFINITGDYDGYALLVDSNEISAIDITPCLDNEPYYKINVHLKNGEAVYTKFYSLKNASRAYGHLSKLWLSTKATEKEMWEVGMCTILDGGKNAFRRLDDNELK